MRICIFHFNAIEKYPPVTNLIGVLQQQLRPGDRVTIFTTRHIPGEKKFTPNDSRIRVFRLGRNNPFQAAAGRYANYLLYNLGALLLAIFCRPQKLLYFESVSAFAPVQLKKRLFRKAGLLIHYHEYMTPGEYAANKLSNYLFKSEKEQLHNAAWISHTNKYRMFFFKEDLGEPNLPHCHVFPNFPPAAWYAPPRTTFSHPLKLVYAGSFGSMDTIYVAEMLSWIKRQEGSVTLDIYSFNISAAVQHYIDQLNCPYVQVKGRVDYYDLPALFKQYDIGLILYKGENDNVVFCASNKLFEYLMCGLDVWYPAEMKGTWDYDLRDQRPRVIRVDFNDPDKYLTPELFQQPANGSRHVDFACETACAPIINQLLGLN